MHSLSIEIRDDIAQAIKLPISEARRRLKRELALRLYEKELLSFGKARELAEMPRWAFQELLGDEGICRHYGVQQFEEDLKTLEALK